MCISTKKENLIMRIQANYQSNVTPSFGAHIPKTFGGVMNYMYKNAQRAGADAFECSNTVLVSTKLKSGKEVSGSVNFVNGRYVGLSMDEGFEPFRKEFITTVIEKFKKSLTKGKLKDKLGYND